MIGDDDAGPSRGMDRRDLIFGGAATVAAAVAYVRTPRKRDMKIGRDELERIVPFEVGPWRREAASGIVLPPPDQSARLIYDQQVSRSYSSETKLPVMFLMAYGSSQSGILQIHRPEICYPASGFALTETVEHPIPLNDGRTVPTRSFVANSATRVEQVLYWTRVGNDLPVSWSQQRLAVVRSNIRGYVPDGLLVRMSVISQDHGQASATLEEFARTMLALIGPKGREQLLGFR